MFKLTTLALVVGLGAFGCTSSGGDSSKQQGVAYTSDDGCTYTQGFWKTHPDAWPVSSVELGTVTYSKADALRIFNQPVQGNGLIALAHQLIAAKLNVAAGAADDEIADAIAKADALIGSLVVPPVGTGSLSSKATSSLVSQLDNYNNGLTGPGHCGDTPPPPPPPPACGDGKVNQTSEQCDDGNTVDGDGCSATCQTEPYCGDGHQDANEECDDGNMSDGDGCSSRCEVEKLPVCGDGRIDAGEQCDDGNTVDGDGCSSRCVTEKTPVCGDGRLDYGEQCDDGNIVDGDGCSSRCEIEGLN